MWGARCVGAGEGGGPARILRSQLLRRRRPVTGHSSEHFLDTLLNGGASVARRGDDQDRVVARERAGDFFPVLAIEGGGKRLGASGRSFQHQHVLRGADVQQEFFERASQRRQRRGLLGGSDGKRTVAFGGLD